jgi:hypothetical protein
MSVISEPMARARIVGPVAGDRPMTARMHPLFVELFIRPADDPEEGGETRRARARRATRKREVVRPRPTPRKR